MNTTDAPRTPSTRDAGLRLRRRLTVGSAAAATLALGLFAAIGAVTIPGTAAASSAATSSSATTTAAAAATSATTTTTSQAATTTVTQPAASATPVAVSGGSH